MRECLTCGISLELCNKKRKFCSQKCTRNYVAPKHGRPATPPPAECGVKKRPKRKPRGESATQTQSYLDAVAAGSKLYQSKRPCVHCGGLERFVTSHQCPKLHMREVLPSKHAPKNALEALYRVENGVEVLVRPKVDYGGENAI